MTQPDLPRPCDLTCIHLTLAVEPPCNEQQLVSVNICIPPELVSCKKLVMTRHGSSHMMCSTAWHNTACQAPASTYSLAAGLGNTEESHKRDQQPKHSPLAGGPGAQPGVPSGPAL